MANRWCDGFGRYGGVKANMLNGSSGQAWAAAGSRFTLSTDNPRTGTHCLRMTPDAGGSGCRRVFGAPLSEVFLGIAIYVHTLPSKEFEGSATYLFSIRDQANNQQFTIVLGTDGALEARRGATVLGRTVPIIGAGAYQHIELYAVAGNGTAGAIEIRVDEVTKLNLTGIDTVTSASVEFSQWAFGYETGGGTDIDFADAYCNDTVADGSGCDSFIGDCKSSWREVNADTAQADFALSAGVSGYALLDDIPPNDAEYISTASSTARSDFGFVNGPGNESEILTARPAVRAWKDDAGTCEIAPSIVSNGDDATVTSQPLTTAPAYYDSNVPIDPDTGVPWTPAALNAAFEIIERTA